MAQIGLKRASELTGKSQSTIHRAMKAGRLSYAMSPTGERLIDVSELERVFPLEGTSRNDAPPGHSNATQAIDIAEIRELRARLEGANASVALLRDVLADVREDRDRWRAQAEATSRLLSDQGGAGEGSGGEKTNSAIMDPPSEPEPVKPRRWWQPWRRRGVE